jgi:hypothetical protein
MSNARNLAQMAVTPLGFKNRLINGDMRVSQRGNVAINGNGNYYGGADRWMVSFSGFATVASSVHTAGTLNGSNTTTSGLVQEVGATTTTGAGNIAFVQRIEAANCVGLGGKPITFSFSMLHDAVGTLSPTINFYKPNATDNFTGITFLTGVAASLPSGTLTKFAFTATLPQADIAGGLEVRIAFPLGAVSGRYFQIADAQLEIGTVATPLEYRPYPVELAMCQRYYEAGNFIWRGHATTGSMYGGSVPFKVEKRANPSVVTTVNVGVAFDPAVNAGVNGYSTAHFDIGKTATGTGGGVFADFWKANAEL